MAYKKNTNTAAGQARHLVHVTSRAIARKANGGCRDNADGMHRYRGANQQCSCGALHK